MAQLTSDVELSIRSDRWRLIMIRVWPVWQSTDWRPLILDRIRESSNWANWSNIVVRADEATDRTDNRFATTPSEILGKLFLRHWHSQASSADVEMARRGFYSMEELGRTVRRFFALDIQNVRGGTLILAFMTSAKLFRQRVSFTGDNPFG